MAAVMKLKEQGWFLTEEGLRKLSDDGKIIETKELSKKAQDTDLREISKGWLSGDYQKHGKIEMPTAGVIMQVVEIRNISAPKCNEESKAAPRLLQIDLTDGQKHARGIEYEHISSLTLNMAPGTKIKLLGTIELAQGVLLLTPQKVSVVGGQVAILAEKWEAAKILGKYASGRKVNIGPNGPPPWIPFGQKNQSLPQSDKSFKSLNDVKTKEPTKENTKFLAIRNESIAEVLKLKQKKIFGGNSRQLQDFSTKRIADKGYIEDQTKSSLKYTRTNIDKSLGSQKHQRDQMSSEIGGKPSHIRNNREDRFSRKNNQETSELTKPSAKVSLFDYLEEKIKLPQTNTPTKAFSNLYPTEQAKLAKTTNSGHIPKADPSSNVGRPMQRIHQSAKSEHRNKFENNISASFANRQKKDEDQPTRSETKLKSNADQLPNPLSNYANKNYSNFSGGPKNVSTNVSDVRGNGHTNYQSGVYQSTKYQKGPGVDGNNIGRLSRFDDKKNQNNYTASGQDRLSNKLFTPSSTNQLIEATNSLKLTSQTPPSARHQQMQSKQQSLQHTQPSSHQQTNKTPFEKVFPHIPNGFEYNPYKIMGFQNKETNEFAMNVLKTQNFDRITMQPHHTMIAQPHAGASLPCNVPTAVHQTPQTHQQPALIPIQSSGLHDQQFMPLQSINAQPPHVKSPHFMAPNVPVPGFNWSWTVNDICFAKYWEDGRYYHAEITGVSDKTCVVQFLEYGNYEEVLLSDCIPVTDANIANINQYNGNLPSIANQYQQRHPHQQTNHSHQQQQQQHQQRFRGDRQMYVPPAQRNMK